LTRVPQRYSLTTLEAEARALARRRVSGWLLAVGVFVAVVFFYGLFSS
jgi:hypothetical protein